MKLPILPLLALGLVSALTLQAEDKTYNLKIERENQVGTKTKETLSGTNMQKQTVSMGGQVVQEMAEKFSGKISGTREVLAVDARKRVSKIKFTVEKMTTKTDDEPEKEALEAGKEIVVESAAGESKCTVDGQEPAPEVRKLAGLVFEVAKEDKPETTIDDAFNTQEPRKPGAEWKADLAKLLKSMPADMPFDIETEGSSGKISFPEVKDVEGTPCCRVQINLDLKVKGLKGLPPEMKPTGASLKVEMKGALPEKATLPALDESMTMNMDFAGTMATPDGQEAQIKITNEMHKEGQARLVK